MDLIDLSRIDGTFPRFIYKRLETAGPKCTFFSKIEYGFGYLLRRLRVKYPDVNPSASTTDYPIWTANNAYNAGDVIYSPVLSAAIPNPPVFICTVPGQSGGGEPAPWNLLRGGTTIDNAVTWTTYDPVLDFGAFVPDLSLEVLDHANNTPRQPSPVKVDLLTSPGRAGSIYRNAPSPADNDIFSVNFSSNQPLFSSTLNFLYRYGDLIEITFSGIETVTQLTGPGGILVTVPAFYSPSFIDVVLEGYCVPEKAFDLWKGARI